jgi:hypothetical protein
MPNTSSNPMTVFNPTASFAGERRMAKSDPEIQRIGSRGATNSVVITSNSSLSPDVPEDRLPVQHADHPYKRCCAGCGSGTPATAIWAHCS